MDSGFLELYSGFHKQNFPRFRNPESLTWGDTGKHRVSSKFGISLYSLEYLSKMDETLLCDHSNETSLVALSHGAIRLSAFCKYNFKFN